jgi:hypothetical protein
MASSNSETYTAQTGAASNAASMVATAALTSGKVSFLQIEVLNDAGALSASNTINLGFIPAGMTVVPGLITITTTVTGGAGTFKIGTATDAGVAVDDDAITGSVNAVANTVGTAVLNTSVASVAFSARTLLIATQVGALADNAQYFINIPMVNSN